MLPLRSFGEPKAFPLGSSQPAGPACLSRKHVKPLPLPSEGQELEAVRPVHQAGPRQTSTTFAAELLGQGKEGSPAQDSP